MPLGREDGSMQDLIARSIDMRAKGLGINNPRLPIRDKQRV